jgi:DNA-binding NtrC family response regulator
MAEILVIHRHADVRQLLLDSVRRWGHTASSAADLHQARAYPGLTGTQYAVILLDGHADDGLANAVEQAKAEWPLAEVVVIGDAADLRAAVAAVQHGAFDYLVMPDNAAALIEVIGGAVARATPPVEVEADASRDGPVDAIAVDPLTRSIFTKADRVAAVNCTVLITGESGTGKEVLARRIHRRGARSRFKFVAVNCGSLPEALVETELFGYKKGAFTGAAATSKGLIEEAEGGVLFLDEIGDMPLPVQVRLLRFLDSGEIRPVGDTVARRVDVRVIAATHRSLTDEIRRGRFREDLFFRLSVVSLHLPPLRQRRADIAALVQVHARRVAAKLGLPAPTISDGAMSLLQRYDWPGNVRELQNALEQALVQRPAAVIMPVDLPPAIRGMGAPTPAAPESAHEDLHAILRRHKGNHTQAAAALGISRSTLWRRLRRLSALSQLSLHPDDSSSG